MIIINTYTLPQANMPVDFNELSARLIEDGELMLSPDSAVASGTPRELKRGWLFTVEQLGKGNFGEVSCLDTAWCGLPVADLLHPFSSLLSSCCPVHVALFEFAQCACLTRASQSTYQLLNSCLDGMGQIPKHCHCFVFVQVWKGLLDDKEHPDVPEYMVAAKMTIDKTGSSGLGSYSEGRAALLKEAAVMAHVGHHTNLVSIIGVISRGAPLVLVVSYCEHGDLVTSLRKKAADGSPHAIDIKLRVLQDITRGMNFLHGRSVVHRDLAARNVLLSSDMVGKVADFGLSRAVGNSEYYRMQDGLFPVKWTAPEAIEDQKFSPASDVWAFAVTAIEVFQDGLAPYTGLSHPQVITLVTDAKAHHERPKLCPLVVYTVLERCFKNDPTERPLFSSLIEDFGLLREMEMPDPSTAVHYEYMDALHQPPSAQQSLADRNRYATDLDDKTMRPTPRPRSALQNVATSTTTDPSNGARLAHTPVYPSECESIFKNGATPLTHLHYGTPTPAPGRLYTGISPVNGTTTTLSENPVMPSQCPSQQPLVSSNRDLQLEDKNRYLHLEDGRERGFATARPVPSPRTLRHSSALPPLQESREQPRPGTSDTDSFDSNAATPFSTGQHTTSFSAPTQRDAPFQRAERRTYGTPLLGWKKPPDVVSIYEELGPAQVLMSDDEDDEEVDERLQDSGSAQPDQAYGTRETVAAAATRAVRVARASSLSVQEPARGIEMQQDNPASERMYSLPSGAIISTTTTASAGHAMPMQHSHHVTPRSTPVPAKRTSVQVQLQHIPSRQVIREHIPSRGAPVDSYAHEEPGVAIWESDV